MESFHNPAISCVVAVYNAAHFIEGQIKEITSFLEQNYSDYELIVVDDGSTDDTLKKLEFLNLPQLKICRLHQNHGQGAALKVGMLQSRGKVVFYTDIDLSTPLSQLKKLTDELAAGADIAIGSRWLASSQVRQSQPQLRRFLGNVFYKLINLFYLQDRIFDTNCGFKAYQGDVARLLYGYVRCWRWAFNTEHLMVAQKLGFKIVEVPVEWSHGKYSRVKIFRDVLFTLFELFLIKLRIFMGSYPKISISSEKSE